MQCTVNCLEQATGTVASLICVLFVSYMFFLHLRQMAFDPEDPRCARLTLTGQMLVVAPEEVAFAKEALFSR